MHAMCAINMEQFSKTLFTIYYLEIIFVVVAMQTSLNEDFPALKAMTCSLN